MQNLTELFKCLSEPVRLRLLFLLYKSSPACVCDLMEALGLPQSVVSRHLSYLRKYDLVVTHKQAQWNFYQLNPNYNELNLLNSILEQAGQNRLLNEDFASLTQLTSACAEVTHDNKSWH